MMTPKENRLGIWDYAFEHGPEAQARRRKSPLRSVLPALVACLLVSSLVVSVLALAPVWTGRGGAGDAALGGRSAAGEQPLPEPGFEQPQPPFLLAGFTRDSAGNPLPGCEVNITNKRTGNSAVVNSDADGYYNYNLRDFPGGIQEGDIINVTATKDLAIGWNETAIPPQPWFYILMDVTLGTVIPEFPSAVVPIAGVIAVLGLVALGRRRR